MRVGLLTQWFAPEPGGALVPSVLARGMAARGHQVEVLTGFPNYPTGKIHDGYRQRLRHRELLPNGVGVRRVPLYPNHNQRAAQRSLNYLSFATSAGLVGANSLAECEALWVFNSPATVPMVARRVRRRYGVPYLLHIMDVWPDSVTESGMVSGSRAGVVVDRLLTRLVARGYDGASRIAVTSRGQLDLLVGRGVPSHLLEYCPVWADEEIFHPRPADRSLLPPEVRSADRVLMYAGALGHVQALDVAVRAAVAAEGTGLHLVFVGSGIAESSLRALSEELGAGNVHFLGRRAPEEMGDLSSAADGHLVSLVDSPLLRVTMPSKVPAVMALGKPIVMVGAGDASDVVREAGAGLVAVGSDDAVVARAFHDFATADASQLEEWGSRGREYYIRELSEERGLTRVESMLESIAQGRTHPGH